ncbi:MAG: FitA-like ribbon-helix-helix domain-containing protein [Sporichthyaceae bacterium]
MPALHVRDVPPAVMLALKERAARHGRSVQEEVRTILAAAAAEPAPPRDLPPLKLHTVSVGGRHLTRDEIYGDDDRR